MCDTPRYYVRGSKGAREIRERVIKVLCRCLDNYDEYSPNYSIRLVLIQDKPNTAVSIEFECDVFRAVGIGFSKVNWPDVWDEDKGESIARGKALGTIASGILENVGHSEDELQAVLDLLGV